VCLNGLDCGGREKEKGGEDLWKLEKEEGKEEHICALTDCMRPMGGGEKKRGGGRELGNRRGKGKEVPVCPAIGNSLITKGRGPGSLVTPTKKCAKKRRASGGRGEPTGRSFLRKSREGGKTLF